MRSAAFNLNTEACSECVDDAGAGVGVGVGVTMIGVAVADAAAAKKALVVALFAIEAKIEALTEVAGAEEDDEDGLFLSKKLVASIVI